MYLNANFSDRVCGLHPIPEVRTLGYILTNLAEERAPKVLCFIQAYSYLLHIRRININGFFLLSFFIYVIVLGIYFWIIFQVINRGPLLSFCWFRLTKFQYSWGFLGIHLSVFVLLNRRLPWSVWICLNTSYVWEFVDVLPSPMIFVFMLYWVLVGHNSKKTPAPQKKGNKIQRGRPGVIISWACSCLLQLHFMNSRTVICSISSSILSVTTFIIKLW